VVQDLINGAYRAFGYLGRGAALTAADSFDALEALNDLIDEANNDRLMIYQIARNTFPLVPGTQVYTLGVGGVFSMPRPPRIERLSVLLTSQTPAQEIPIEMLDDIGWQNITLKQMQPSYFPTVCFPDNAFPLNNLSMWPIPSSTCSIVIYSWQQLAAFTSLNQQVAFPPGYKNFLRYGLAIRMAPEKGFECSPTIHTVFANAKAMIRNVNWRPGKVEIETMLYGRSNTMRAVKSQGLVVD
jgi:hypothetical protein